MPDSPGSQDQSEYDNYTRTGLPYIAISDAAETLLYVSLRGSLTETGLLRSKEFRSLIIQIASGVDRRFMNRPMT